MIVQIALVLFLATVQATPVSNTLDVQLARKYVEPNPRHTAAEWTAIYSAAEADVRENTTGLVLGTSTQPEDAGKVFVDPEDRIIDGLAASRGQIPWQALLVVGGGVGFGGGSLISTEWVLTAAHCVDGYSSFQVTLGSISRVTAQPGSITQNVRQVIAHANYDPKTIANDIALLKLASAATLSNYISVVRLPRRSEASTTFAGSSAMASGFGIMDADTNKIPENLLYADVNIITNAVCAKSYGSTVQPTNICSIGTNGKTPCTGDSGGPLVVRESDGRYTLVGVVSFTNTRCSTDGPTGYTRVTKYLAWISSSSGIAIQN